MIRRSYEIKGFDCANCAAKTERHLNKHEAIESAVIDFAGDRLHIVYKNKELSVEEILEVIKEVETDEISLVLLGEKKPKVYHIHGFDCANCAAKAERHLNKHEAIESCTLDFAGDRLHVTYKSSPLTAEQLKEIIREVETDEIELTEISKKTTKKSLFTKNMWWLMVRVIIAVAIMLVSHLVLKDDKYFWIVFSLYIVGIFVITYDVFWKVINHIIHLENPIDESLLISLSAVGAFLVAAITKESHAFMDSLMVVTLYQIGKVIEGIATNKSKQAISAAVDLRVELAHKVVDGAVKDVAPEDLALGDLVIVTNGELIPIDGVVVEGEALVDTSSLTGEFVPIAASKNTEVYSGCLIKSGTITLKVNKEYKDSTVNKIAELISNSGAKKSRADEFVTKFARWYTPIVFVVSLLTGVIGGLITSNWRDWAILGLKMMVVACPCAIVISVPMAYFSAVGLASKNGIVVKGTNYLDKLVELRKLVTDKTGTLTEGEFKVTKINAVKDEKELLEALYAAEYLSTHPIGRAICKDVDVDEIAKKCKDFQELAGLGVSINYDGKEIYAGSEKLLKNKSIVFATAEEEGSIVYVAKDNRYLGYVVLSDVIKKDAEEMVSGLTKLGVETILLTGDKEKNAKALCDTLGIKRYHAELLPEDKTQYLEKELSKDYATGFLGDGINDAASIKGADIGLAMGGIGSDAAVDSADVVIMTDHPSKVVDAIKIAKIARHTSIFNIVVALTIKMSIELVAVITNLLGRPEVIPMWLAVLADTGMTVMLVINSLLVLYRRIKQKE